jgi:N-acetylglucosamine-6-phosphate deacetylase
VRAGTAGRRRLLSGGVGKGIRLNAGHSNATWAEMTAAHALGVRHVDHFYCAMSSVSSLRERCGTPMQASMLEFVLDHDDMTTEVIADGRHLSPELLRFVVKWKGAGRTALVTDCSRALDQPPGLYTLGRSTGARRSTTTAASDCCRTQKTLQAAFAEWISWCGTCTSAPELISSQPCAWRR